MDNDKPMPEVANLDAKRREKWLKARGTFTIKDAPDPNFATQEKINKAKAEKIAKDRIAHNKRVIHNIKIEG